MSIINALLFFVPHKSVKFGILFQIIHINYYFIISNQYNSYIGIFRDVVVPIRSHTPYGLEENILF